MSCVTQPKGHVPSTFHPVSAPSHPIPSSHRHISHIARSQITLVVQSLKYISVTLVFVAVVISQDSLTSWDGKSTSGSWEQKWHSRNTQIFSSSSWILEMCSRNKTQISCTSSLRCCYLLTDPWALDGWLALQETSPSCTVHCTLTQEKTTSLYTLCQGRKRLFLKGFLQTNSPVSPLSASSLQATACVPQ